MFPLWMMMKPYKTTPILEFKEILLWFSLVSWQIVWYYNWFIWFIDATPSWYSNDFKVYKYNILTEDISLVWNTWNISAYWPTPWKIMVDNKIYFINWSIPIPFPPAINTNLVFNVDTLSLSSLNWSSSSVSNPYVVYENWFIYKVWWYSWSWWTAQFMTDCERYNISTNTWETLTSMNSPTLTMDWGTSLSWVSDWNNLYFKWKNWSHKKYNISWNNWTNLINFPYTDSETIAWWYINWQVFYFGWTEKIWYDISWNNFNIETLWFWSSSAVVHEWKMYILSSTKIWIFTYIT